MAEIPETYNELVELIENNEPGVVAQIIQENYTSNEMLKEMDVGRERSREEIERKL